MYEDGFGKILKGLFLMGLVYYILPLLAVAGIIYGAGLWTGYLLWH